LRIQELQPGRPAKLRGNYHAFFKSHRTFQDCRASSVDDELESLDSCLGGRIDEQFKDTVSGQLQLISEDDVRSQADVADSAPS